MSRCTECLEEMGPAEARWNEICVQCRMKFRRLGMGFPVRRMTSESIPNGNSTSRMGSKRNRSTGDDPSSGRRVVSDDCPHK